MTDFADDAQAREAQFLAACLNRVHHVAHEGEMVSRTHCETCGELIPEARRVAVPGVRLCVECQEVIDQC